MPYTVVILSGNPTNLAACVYALLANEPELQPSDILVVHDKDARGCEPRLPQGIRWVPGARPFVFARNANIGIEAAGGDVFLLNDDARLQTFRGLTTLYETWAKCPTLGLVAAAVQGPCGNPRQRAGHPCNPGMTLEPDRLCFIGVLIPRRIYEQVGPLDEQFVGYGYDDDDYSLRVRQAGYHLATFGSCILDHGTLTPSFRNQEHVAEQMALNASLFSAKWPELPPPANTGRPMLSVLICSMESRTKERTLLLEHLNTLRAMLPDPWQVEIRLNIDQRQKTVGRKRNELLAQALAPYSAFLDDDDQVDKDYFVDILAALQTGPDCVTFDAWVTWNHRPLGRAIYDLAYEKFANIDLGHGRSMFERTPNHLSVVRTELARAVGFPEQNFGEDTDYAQRLRPLLKTQVRIPKILYFYQYSPEASETNPARHGVDR